MIRERTFVQRREPRWKRLEELLQTAERRGVERLDGERLEELARLYRAVTSDLAAAQSREYESKEYLNRLCARAHGIVYAPSSEGGWGRIARFFTVIFPSEVRRSWRPIGTCAAITVAAAVVSYSLVIAKPSNVYAFLPGEEIPAIHKSLHDTNFAVKPTFAPTISAFIITNNVQVAAVAFAGGISFGLLTLWIILQNGLMLGSLGALFAARGFGTDFWATIAPHGVIELSAIQIAGGAGLLLAIAVVAPGRLRRIDALKRNARRAGTLVVGVAAMLVVAGTIEGFYTPLRTAPWARVAVGIVTGVLLALYLGLAGRFAAVKTGRQSPPFTPERATEGPVP